MRNLLLAGAAAIALTACQSGGTTEPTGTTSTGGTTTADGSGGESGLGSLINVNLSDISAEVARNMQLNLEDVPVSIQLPVNVAANVCGVDVNLLSVNVDTAAGGCTASTTSAELEQAIRNQMG